MKNTHLQFVSHRIEKKNNHRRTDIQVVERVRKKKTVVDIIDWQPDLHDIAYARDHNVDPERIIQDIHDWAENAALSKRRKRNPKAFWQTWVRREADRPGRQTNNKLKFDHL